MTAALNTIKILQGRADTQTTLGGLAIYPEVANFPQGGTHAKNYQSRFTVDEVIAIITFLDHPVVMFKIRRKIYIKKVLNKDNFN